MSNSNSSHNHVRSNGPLNAKQKAARRQQLKHDQIRSDLLAKILEGEYRFWTAVCCQTKAVPSLVYQTAATVADKSVRVSELTNNNVQPF
jgi:hypothetical protein